MHYTFHHIPKTGGSSLRIRLEDRANKKQISKLDYAVGHNTTFRTPGTHFVWLRHPLDRDISQYNYDMGKGDIDGDSFEDHCYKLEGNFIILWLYTNYLCKDKVDSIQKYNPVTDCDQLPIFSYQKIDWSLQGFHSLLDPRYANFKFPVNKPD